MYGISGGVRDGHVSLPGLDHLPGPWPDLRWSDRWTVVPLHSKSELSHSQTQKDFNYQLSQTGTASKHHIHICLHMRLLLCCDLDVNIFMGSSAPVSFQCFKGTACVLQLLQSTTTQTDTVYVQIVNVQHNVFYLACSDLMCFMSLF